MARWWLHSIIVFSFTWLLVIGRSDRQIRQDYLVSLLQDPKQIELIESMLKNQQAKLMKSFDKSVNSMGPPVWVGASPPSLPSSEFGIQDDLVEALNASDTMMMSGVPSKRNGHHHNHRLVRSRNEPLSEEICKTNRYWKQINETRDIYGQEVHIVHSSEFRQFAFVYECIREGESCSGIAEQLQSTCEMRPGWANMLHIKLSTLESNGAPLWGYVAVPHHCACRIYPRVNPFVI